MQVPQGVVQVLSRRRGRHLGYPRGTLLAGQLLGFPQDGLVDHVKHGVAHHRWIAWGLLRHSLELHGYGW
jgi:hypothetical protein